MINVRELSGFDGFVRTCAARCGEADPEPLGTCRRLRHHARQQPGHGFPCWRPAHLVQLLPAHHRNFSKRLMKSPKLYFLDTGLAAWLLGIQSSDALLTTQCAARSSTSWVVSELLKGRHIQAPGSNLYFWRDRSGLEIDVLIDQGEMLVPVEAESGRDRRFRFHDRHPTLERAGRSRRRARVGGLRGRRGRARRTRPKCYPGSRWQRLVSELNPTPQL